MLLPWQHEWEMNSRRDVRHTIDGREETGERKYGSDILGICEGEKDTNKQYITFKTLYYI